MHAALVPVSLLEFHAVVLWALERVTGGAALFHVQIIRDKATLVSKGFGFVSFAHPAYATLAMQQMDQQVRRGWCRERAAL